MREIDEAELLSMLKNRAIGASDELERIRRGAPVTGSRDEAIGFYEGRVDTYEVLLREFTRELKGEAEAPRFFV